MKVKYLVFLLVYNVFFSCDNVRYHINEPGIDYQEISQAYKDAENIPSLRSLIVVRDGKIINERYFHATLPDQAYDVKSVTKSVMSLLIGIAIDKGYIENSDMTLNDLVKAGKIRNELGSKIDSIKRNISIRHLLTMSGGFAWPAFGDWSEYQVWRNSPNQFEYIMNKEITDQPGSYFRYNDAASHLLSVILTEVTGMSTYGFAREYLFRPLGIGEKQWDTDRQGYYLGCVALYLTPRDMVRLGTLVLNQGFYNRKRVVSQEWIRASTHRQIVTNINVPYGGGYGFLWWVHRSDNIDFYYANGYGGQFIVVVPHLKTVVAATNKFAGYSERQAGENWYKTINIIVERILPAIE